MEDEFFMIGMAIVGVFIVISCCLSGIFGFMTYNRRKNQAIFSTPVVITDQSFTPNNQSQLPQYPINLQISSQTSSNTPNQRQQQSTTVLPPCVPQSQQQAHPPIATNLPRQQETINVQMPMPYHDSSNSTSQTSHIGDPIYPVTAVPSLPSSSNQTQNNDPPPSYFKIDKLRD